MRIAQQRVIALEAARALLPLMGLQPEFVKASDVLCVFDELFYTQPQSVAYQWYASASDRQLDLFVDEWEAWREKERARCAFCLGRKDRADCVFCTACSELLEGSEEVGA